MKNIQELKEHRMHLILSAEDVTKKAEAEGRLLTDEEDRNVASLLEQAEGDSKSIEVQEAQEQQKMKLRSAVDSLRARATPSFDISRVAKGSDIEDRKAPVIEEVRGRLAAAGAKVDATDGVRVLNADGWWLLRASNTQDVLVARCEAADAAGLARLKAQLGAQLAASGLALPDDA